MADADLLLDRFRPALSERAFALLEPLLRYAALAEEDGAVVCEFAADPRDGDEDADPAARQLRILPVAGGAPDSSPASLRALLRVCGGMELGVVGDTGQLVLHDGYSGTLAVVGDYAWNECASGVPWSSALCAPIDMDLQAFYVLHPRTGRLCLSDGSFEAVRDTDDPVEVYLREVHLRLKTWRPPETPLQRAVAGTPDRTEWLEAIGRSAGEDER